MTDMYCCCWMHPSSTSLAAQEYWCHMVTSITSNKQQRLRCIKRALPCKIIMIKIRIQETWKHLLYLTPKKVMPMFYSCTIQKIKLYDTNGKLNILQLLQTFVQKPWDVWRLFSHITLQTSNWPENSYKK